MIARYSRPEMARIWEDRYRYSAWLKVEMAVCEELALQGLIPAQDWKDLKKNVQAFESQGGVDPKRVDHHEALVRHDVIAFTTTVAEGVGPLSRYIHFGLTSSDVVDTAFSLLLQEAGNLIQTEIQNLLKTLKKQAEKYKNLPTIGRSHGIFAEPTSFGLKFLGWYCEWERNLVRLQAAQEGIRYGKLSGAVGVNPHFGPEFEERVLNRLGLQREKVSTQILPRDRHAEFIWTLSAMGSSLERIAVELRHLQRSEVGEVIEGFRKGQKGSSAMPHKRNPISSENISGCARLLRSYVQASLENIPLWHERDISHSSAERVIFPDATLLTHYALVRMRGVLEELGVDSDRIAKNLASAGSAVFSGHYLLELVQLGVTREEAYGWIQECALKAFQTQGDFVALLEAHPQVSTHLSVEKIKELGSISYQLRNVDEIFARALGDGKS